MSESEAREPLPIWFFVGLVLSVYGLILVLGGFLFDVPPAVKIVTPVHPGILWGGCMLLVGVLFVVSGIRGRRG